MEDLIFTAIISFSLGTMFGMALISTLIIKKDSNERRIANDWK